MAVLVLSGLAAVPAANAVGFTISGHVDVGTSGANTLAGEVRVQWKVEGGETYFSDSRSVLTDSAGNYSITGLTAGVYRLYFKYLGAGSYAGEYWQDLVDITQATPLTVSADVSGINALLGPKPVVSGVVSLGSNGNHPAGETVRVTWDRQTEFGWSNGPSTGVTTDANGAYSVQLDPGTYRFTYGSLSDNYQQRSGVNPLDIGGPSLFVLGTTSVSGVDLTLPSYGSISGHVNLGTSSTSASAGAVKVTYSACYASDGCVSGVPPTTYTDAAGNYTFGHLSPGTYTLSFFYVAGPSYQKKLNAIVVTVSDAQLTHANADVTLTTSGSISGQVFLGSTWVTATAGQVTVNAWQRDCCSNIWTKISDDTDADGNFSIVGLSSGSYTIEYQYNGGSEYSNLWWLNAGGQSSASQVNVTTTALTGYNVTLQQGASFTGVVKNSSGAAVAGRQVIAHRYVTGSYIEQGQYSVHTASDGSFTLAALPEGRYYVEVYDGLISGPYGRQWIGGTADRPQPDAIVLSAGQQYAFGDVTVLRPSFLTGVVTCDTCDTVLEPEGMYTSLYAQAPSGEWVYAGGADMWSYPGGYYQFRLLRPGSYQIRAGFAGDGSGYTPYVSPTFEITEGQQLTRPDIVLVRAAGTLPLGKLVKSSAAGSTDVYLVADANTLIPVTSLATAADAGIPSTVSAVAPSLLTPYSVDYRALSNVISCGGTTYVASGGQLWPVDPAVLAGLVPTELSTAVCADLPKSSTTVLGALFLTPTGGGATYYLESLPSAPTFAYAPAKRQVLSVASTQSLASPHTPITLPVASAFLNTIVTGPKVLPVGSMVKGPGPRVYFVAGFQHLVPMLTFDATTDMGLPSTFSQVSQADLDQAVMDPDSAALSNVLVCGTTTYIASAGKLWPVDAALVAALPKTTLDASACSVLPKSTTTVQGALFLTATTGGAIYQVQPNGTKRQIISTTSMAPLAAPYTPVTLKVGASFLNAIPTGLKILPVGQMVKGPGPRVYFVAGFDHLVPMLSFDPTVDMGLAPSFSVVSQADLDQAVKDPDSAALSNVVVCGSVTYFAAEGKLWPVEESLVAGLGRTVLDASACSLLPKSATTIRGALFVMATTGGGIYMVTPEGTKRQLLTTQSLGMVSAPHAAVVLKVGPYFMDSLPTGLKVLPPGSLVKSATQSSVFLVDGFSRRIPVPNIALATAGGINSSVITVSQAEIDALALDSGTPAPLSSLIGCNSKHYQASGGSYRVLASAGSGELVLDATTCSQLRLVG